MFYREETDMNSLFIHTGWGIYIERHEYLEFSDASRMKIWTGVNRYI